MSFAAPLALLALLAVPALVWAYRRAQAGRRRAAAAFVSPHLIQSPVPAQPGRRRHVPLVVLGLALVVLILAAARPQRSVAVPLKDGAVMLADDVSSSMAARDLAPNRLGAAQRAARRFLAGVPPSIRVGVLQFNQKAVVLQSPTADRGSAGAALGQLRVGGRTAIGDAINTSVQALSALRAPGGRRLPAAIVLLSDGTSTVGADPLVAARAAAAQHIAVHTVSLGTPSGTIAVPRGRHTVQVPVPVDSSELRQIARVSGGRTFTAASTGDLKSVYEHLAATLGHHRVKQQMSSSFIVGGLILVLVGSAVSVRWLGRLV